jgi:hypothetical protein
MISTPRGALVILRKEIKDDDHPEKNLMIGLGRGLRPLK